MVAKKKVVKKATTDAKHRMLGSVYRGSKAKSYDEERLKQRKWHKENEIIVRMLEKGTTALDCPVGTGRFLKEMDKRVIVWVGVDSSQDMLDAAAKKSNKGTLRIGDAGNLDYKDRSFHTVLCVRMLHLVPKAEMERIFTEASRVAKNQLILTIQMRKTYREGLNVVTHTEAHFDSLVKKLGWKKVEKHKLTGAGWHVVRLER